MGCSSSKASAAGGSLAESEVKENRKIDAAQKKAAEEAATKVELLILGTGDSGKTTLRKQLANVHNKIFESENYRRTFAPAIMSNLLDGTMELLSGLHRKDETYRYLDDLTKTVPTHLDDKAADMLKALVQGDPEFLDIIARHDNAKIQLQDCWFVYAEKLKDYPTWGGALWVPSADDCVRSRVRTSGIIKEELVIDGMPFVIYDVGGQRAERRKWMHMFDSVMSCIFVAALSEYDQVLFEDRTKNRLEEALDLFAEIVNSNWLANATTLLFLNKKDLFQQKFCVDKIPLNVSGLFPDAPQDQNDIEGAIKWISKQFTSKKKGKGQGIYVHVTTATDPSNIQAVFKLARETILGRNMKDAGFIIG